MVIIIGKDDNVGNKYSNCGIRVNHVKVLDDSDFKNITELCENHTGWNVAYNKDCIKVWTKSVPKSNLHMIKAKAMLSDVPASVVYDVLHDPQYRPKWDKYHVATIDIGLINPNNDICYYAVGGMAPLKVRDFVLQRSWLDVGKEKYICSHSICHEKCPPVKGYIRGIVYLTAYYIRDLEQNGCQVTYINHSDPKGEVPAWLTNHLAKVIGPKFIRRIHKACLKYENWKANNCPDWKPWIYPEQQINLMRVNLSECSPREYDMNETVSSIDKSEISADNVDDSNTSDDE
uniref:START domain-containing protein 10 n=1 Tax=Setaria digitata TaxID=48799 RepID=A0A915PPH4_9BILA